MQPMKRHLKIVAVLSALIFLLPALSAYSQNKSGKSPKLILQITVDQLRGDMPGSVYDQWGTDDSYVTNWVMSELSLTPEA